MHKILNLRNKERRKELEGWTEAIDVPLMLAKRSK
jgi:hypothetical protein